MYDCPCCSDHVRREPDDSETRTLWAALEQKLISFGGHRAVWMNDEPNLTCLLKDGKLYQEPVVMKASSLDDCYENMARAWGKDVENTQLATGYALNDNKWRPHDWAIRDGAIWEFGVSGEKYFGIILTEAQALRFWITHFAVSRYPNPERDSRKLAKQYPGPNAIMNRLAAR